MHLKLEVGTFKLGAIVADIHVVSFFLFCFFMGKWMIL